MYLFQLIFEENKKFVQKSNWNQLRKIVRSVIDFKRVEREKFNKKLKSVANVINGLFWNMVMRSLFNHFVLCSYQLNVLMAMLEYFFHEGKYFKKALIYLLLCGLVCDFLFSTDNNIG